MPERDPYCGRAGCLVLASWWPENPYTDGSARERSGEGEGEEEGEVEAGEEEEQGRALEPEQEEPQQH